MSKREAITRYALIVKKLERRACSFAELYDYLQMQSELRQYNFTISKRTFQRDIDEIRTILDKDIQYDFSKKVYFINDNKGDGMQERLLEAFDTFTALNLVEGVSKYIQFEQRRPQGMEHFHDLLYAIKHGYVVKFNYYKYWDLAMSNRTVVPLLLKEARSRWYVVAKDFKDSAVKTFGLDRISDLEITKTVSTPDPGFDVEHMFANCFGVINSEQDEPQQIILSFNKIQGQYIKSYPLHRSQKVTETATEIVIELFLKITQDFLMELLSFGGNMKVISPQTLIADLLQLHENAQQSLIGSRAE